MRDDYLQRSLQIMAVETFYFLLQAPNSVYDGLWSSHLLSGNFTLRGTEGPARIEF
jgi:hypothetical protein